MRLRRPAHVLSALLVGAAAAGCSALLDIHDSGHVGDDAGPDAVAAPSEGGGDDAGFDAANDAPAEASADVANDVAPDAIDDVALDAIPDEDGESSTVGPAFGEIDLVATTFAPPAASHRALNAFAGLDGSRHVHYVDGVGHVQEMYLEPGATWLDVDVMNATQQDAGAATASALHGYWGGDNSQHVNFTDANGRVNELYLYPGMAHWALNVLTLTIGAPESSALTGYQMNDNSQHVDYVDGQGHVHELYFRPGASWVDNDLTVWAKSIAVASPSAIVGYWMGDESQHVIYVDSIDHLHELYFGLSIGTWIDTNLTTVAGAPPAASGSAIDAYQGTDRTQHVNYVDAAGDVHELSFAPREDGGWAWADEDLSKAAGGGVPRASLGGLAAFWSGDASQHVHFFDAAGGVHEIEKAPGAAWAHKAWSVAAADPNGTLVAYPGTGIGCHLVYADGAGHVHEAWGDDPPKPPTSDH